MESSKVQISPLPPSSHGPRKRFSFLLGNLYLCDRLAHVRQLIIFLFVVIVVIQVEFGLFIGLESLLGEAFEHLILQGYGSVIFSQSFVA